MNVRPERRIEWTRASMVPPIETDDTILERKAVLTPMQPDAPPFLLLGEDRFVAGAFPMHPHQGIETVTYIVDGAVEHRDTAGNTGIVRAGGVQWMTAGRGIRHSEEPVGDTPAHTFQLWIDLPNPLKNVEPNVQTAQFDEHTLLDLGGATLRIAAGTLNGATGPITPPHPATVSVVDMEADADVQIEVSPEQAALLYVRTGSAEVLGTALAAGHGAYISPGNGALGVRSAATTQLLLYAAVPSGE